jgi:hypothetical protein
MPFIKLFMPRIYSEFQKTARARLLRLFLPGAAPLGDFPNLVNAGGVIEGLLGYRAYSGPKKPLHNSRGPYTQNLGYFCDGQSFHILNFTYFLKKINSYKQQVIDKLVIYNYDVYIRFRGDINMGKIIPFRLFTDELQVGQDITFQTAKQALELRAVKSIYMWESDPLKRPPEEPEKPYTGPTKRPCIVSALPGETIPPEFPDFRPLLQRDGLILLGWSRWDTAPYHYIGKSPCYTVNWITSAPNRHYRRYSTGYIFQEKMETAKPDGTGDPNFLLGIRGKFFDLKKFSNREVADYVFACAPWDLNSRTIPGFIQELKTAGVKTDFDFPFSLGYAKKLEFTTALQECKVISPHACVWGQIEL